MANNELSGFDIAVMKILAMQGVLSHGQVVLDRKITMVMERLGCTREEFPEAFKEIDRQIKEIDKAAEYMESIGKPRSEAEKKWTVPKNKRQKE